MTYELFRSDKHEWIIIKRSGEVVLSMSLADWSKMIAAPKKVATENYDFSRSQS